MREPASTNPPQVTSSARNARFQGSDSNEADRIDSNLTGKLKSMCPSLYFSLTSWERATLDHSPDWNTLPLPSIDKGVTCADSSKLGSFHHMPQGKPIIPGEPILCLFELLLHLSLSFL
jgi:hypothetical protein